jgi:nucleotide-binding universal stress UspA family protein
MFTRIVIPVDLTEKNAVAVEAARHLAPKEGGEVTLLHVIETLDLPFEELGDFYDQLHEKAVVELDRLAETLAEAGLLVNVRICYGKRVPEIVEHAEANRADLIIMSSRRVDLANPAGHVGTISHQVAILAQSPILLLK